ncbi:MAG: hypothetical protein QNJ22_05685 [Desulfosarcinaceae bacterium]|nr:hypothetical protein [Desulfosarcinaceae bacterium]
MRFFSLLSFQHIVLYVVPTLIFIILFGVGLGYSHFKGKEDAARKHKIIHRYPTGIEERDAPFPLLLIMIIAGTVLWMFLYIVGTGVLEVKI